jgi:hypothetical protein
MTTTARLLNATTLIGALGLVAQSLHAVHASPILVGDSGGSGFTNCTGCGAGSLFDSLKLSTFTLQITPISFTVNNDTPNVPLAQLQFATGNNPTGSANFNYHIILDLTVPTSSPPSSIATTLNLNMASSGTGSNSSETLSPFPLSVPDLALNEVTLSNFHFVNIGQDGNFLAGAWTLSRSGLSDTLAQTSAALVLLADVAATSTGVAEVPEPTSGAILIGAIAGFWMLRRKRFLKPSFIGITVG